MYENQTEEVIKQRMLDRISTDIDKSEGSFTYDAVSPVSGELAQTYIDLDSVLKRVFAQTASGEYLERRAAEFGVSRKQGTKATGIVRIEGSAGVVIPQGTSIQTAGGLLYKTTVAATITGSSVEVNVEAAVIGTMYNVPADTVKKLPTQIIGVTAVTNPNPITGGTDVETDAELLTRLLIKSQTPTASGNANEYKLWALSINGVGDVKIFPLWNGNGTVKVVLINTNKQPADSGLVTQVLNYINSVRPIGATVTVISASALNINISVTVTRDSAYTLSQVTTNITAKLTEYLKSIAFKSAYVSYAQLGNAILDSAGVIDYSGLTVNSGTANISIGAEQTPVLGTVSVT